jgi:hypothetical protein
MKGFAHLVAQDLTDPFDVSPKAHGILLNFNVPDLCDEVIQH